MHKTTKRAITLVMVSITVVVGMVCALIGATIVRFVGNGHESVTDESVTFVEVATFEEVTSEEVISEEITEAPTTKKAENIYYDCPLSHDLQDYIRELCNENGIPMSLVIAMIDVESSFNPDAVSSTDDYGLMQINKCNHGWLRNQGVTDVLDPYQNVYGGITILSQCYNGNMSKALMSYNLGAGGASELWDEGVYSTYYSRLVLETKEVYDAQV
jgi:hypothetical protein